MKRILILLFLILPVDAFAVAHYVRVDGHDTDCNGHFDASVASTPNCAFLTIQYAADHVAAGDVITVGPGSYNEYVNINTVAGTAGNYVTIKAQNPAVTGTAFPLTTADLANRSIVKGFRIQEAYIWLEGFDITGYKGTLAASVRVDWQADHFVFTKNWIRDGIHHTATDYTFNAVASTIAVPAGNSFVTAGFEIGDVVYIGSNIKAYTLNHDKICAITAVSATSMTLADCMHGTHSQPIEDETGVFNFLFITNVGASYTGIRALQFVGSSSGYVEYATISYNKISGILGNGAMMIYGRFHTIEYNDISDIHGWPIFWYYAGDTVFQHNYVHDSSRPDGFFPPDPGIDHSDENSPYWDFFGAIFTSYAVSTYTTNNNYIQYNFFKDLTNEFFTTYAYQDYEDSIGFTMRHNVFYNIDTAGAFHREKTIILNNTFYKIGTIESTGHAFAVSNRIVDPNGGSLANGSIVKNNVFVDIGVQPDQGWYSLGGPTDAEDPTMGEDPNYNYVAGAAPGYASKDDFVGVEVNGINGGDPTFTNVASALGVDGIPFTADDGLKPGAASILAGTGWNGYTIGAYNSTVGEVFPAQPAGGRVYYVDAAVGSDSYSTTQAQTPTTPWLTIQKCADNAVAGDTCSIATGTYNEYVTSEASGTAGNYITFYANGLVTMGTPGGFSITHEYIKIYGDSLATSFNISGAPSANAMIFLQSTSGHCIIDTVTLHDNSGSFKAGIIIQSDYNTFQNSYIYHFNYEMVMFSGGNYNLIYNNLIKDGCADAFVGTGSYNTIRSNTVTNLAWCDPEGLHVDFIQGYGPTPTRYWVIENNLAYNLGNVQLGMIEGNPNYVSNWTFRNNVFCDYYSAQIDGDGFEFYNNVFCDPLAFSGAFHLINGGGSDKNQTNNMIIKNNVFLGFGGAATGWYNLPNNATEQWTADHPVTAGEYVYSTTPNGFHVYRAMNNGTTGATEPDWDAVGKLVKTCAYVDGDHTVTCDTTSTIRTSAIVIASSSLLTYGRAHVETINDATTFETDPTGIVNATGNYETTFYRWPQYTSVASVARGPKVLTTGSYTKNTTIIDVADSTGITVGMVANGCYFSASTLNNYRYVTGVDGNQVTVNASSGSNNSCAAGTAFGFYDDVVEDNGIYWVVMVGSYGSQADYNYAANADYTAKTGFPPTGFDTHGVVSGDPKFTNAAAYDFTISAIDSVLVGKGIAIAGFTTDKNGVVRGAVWDIGPYEFEAGGLAGTGLSGGARLSGGTIH